MLHWKEKTDNSSIIIRRITTAERARAVGLLQQYVSITSVYATDSWMPASEMPGDLKMMIQFGLS